METKEVMNEIKKLLTGRIPYILFHGDALEIISNFPDSFVDCAITSPPYWQLREYNIPKGLLDKKIGFEKSPEEYVDKLVQVSNEIKRILKPTGSFWLNIGDKYKKKNLMGMPWRVALAMQKEGWIVRNDIIWDQRKGTQSVKDRLRDVYEHLFHFVKAKKYYYNDDAIRIKPDKIPYVANGRITSATGVSGVKYRNQITRSKVLTPEEKKNALIALDQVLSKMRNGELVDFRMTIRGRQRTLHSDANSVSGRARELEERGYFILTSKAKGYLPSDIWRIVPEDEWRKDAHYAVFPEELLRVPILATCPIGGILFDPFVGIGSAVVAALRFGRRGIGVDLSKEYVDIAQKRISENYFRQISLELK
jgi:DNA modification methylase